MRPAISLIIAIAVFQAFLFVPHHVLASSDSEDDGGFSFSDLFRTSDPEPERQPARPARNKPQKSYRPVLNVSLSEVFINGAVKRYIPSESPLSKLYIAFNAPGGGVVLRGKVKLPDEVAAEYGLPSEITEMWFQSYIQLKITKKGYIAIVFPKDLTTMWSGTITTPSAANQIKIPNGFLEMIIARTRVHLAVLSGDFSSYRRRRKVIELKLNEEKKLLRRLNGYDRQQKELFVEELEMELQIIDLKIKRARLISQSKNRIVKFLGEAEYRSEKNLRAQRNVLLINPSLDKMFPFLSEVRLGAIEFCKAKGSRYMTLTVNSLIER